jgi:hypothetical protein
MLFNFQSIFNSGFKKDGLALILDIGTASVGAALVCFSPNELPHVLYTVRHPYKKKAIHPKLKTLIPALSETLSLVLDDVLKKGLKQASSIVEGARKPVFVACTLNVPWYISYAKTVNRLEKEPFIINREVLSAAIEKEVDNLKKSAEERYKKEGLSSNKVERIEAETIHVKLNGYSIPKPYGKEAKDLAASIYTSFTPEQTLEVVKKQIFKSLHIRKPSFHSFSLVFFTTLRDIWTNAHTFFAIDMSEEISTISLVRDEVIVNSTSIPFGRNFFIRIIAEECNVPTHEALSLLNLSMTHKLDENVSKKLDKALAHGKEEWLAHFKERIEILCNSLLVPSHVFLAIPNPLGPWFVRLFKEMTLSLSDTTEIGPFTVNLLNYAGLSNFLNIDKSVKNDSFLFLEALFIDKWQGLDS